MNEPIKWERNKFRTFYSQIKFHVGGEKDRNTSIEKGDSFEYDGMIVKYAGEEFPNPRLRGAYNQGWFTLEQDERRVAPVQPNRNVARSQTKNDDLSRVQRTAHMGQESLDEETVLHVHDRQQARQSAKGVGRTASGHLTQMDNRRAGQRVERMQVEQSDLDLQDHVVVGRVNSPAKLGIVDMTSSQSHGLAQSIENRPLGNPVFVEKEGVSIKMSVGNVDPRVREDFEDTGRVVGKVRKSAVRGSSDGVEVLDTSGTPGRRKSPEIDPSLPPRIRVARRIDPDFPSDWSFSGKLAERLAAVKAHGANPAFLEALYAAEGDQMRKKLEEAFPKQFSSK